MGAPGALSRWQRAVRPLTPAWRGRAAEFHADTPLTARARLERLLLRGTPW